MAGGRWQVAGGRWQVAGGRWQVAGGWWLVAGATLAVYTTSVFVPQLVSAAWVHEPCPASSFPVPFRFPGSVVSLLAPDFPGVAAHVLARLGEDLLPFTVTPAANSPQGPGLQVRLHVCVCVVTSARAAHVCTAVVRLSSVLLVCRPCADGRARVLCVGGWCQG